MRWSVRAAAVIAAALVATGCTGATGGTQCPAPTGPESPPPCDDVITRPGFS